MRRSEVLASVVMSLFASSASAQSVEIDVSESIFAVVTHKAGFASGVAHNHLVTAADYDVRLSLDPVAPLAADFELTTSVDKLEVDRWDLEQKWYPRLEQLGVLSEAFSEVAEKDRQKIRDSMLGKSQLHAAKFPDLSAKVVAVEEKATTIGTSEFPFAVKLALEIRGQSVEKTVAARFEQSEGILSIEAVGTFLFSEFGIKPYSAFLGAVKNEDEVHIYVSLRVAVPERNSPS